MTEEMFDREILLWRYSLVGGPDDMIPLLERVSEICTARHEVGELAIRQAAAIFEGVPAPTMEDLMAWQIPEREMGDAIGAYCLMVALAGVPRIAETQRRFGLGEDHLALTFSWFRPIIEIYRRRHGVPGITHTRSFWFRKHADGELFRFGAMEFLRGPVPNYIPADFRASLKPEDEVPTFHFPGGPGGLDPLAIKSAFAEATAFWKRAFGRYPKAWACDSWLFNPAWRELIPNTRIAHAIDLYDELPPLAYNPSEPSGLFFVYNKERCDPRDYPATNSLERAFVELYERGQKPCDGCAWVKVSEDGKVLFRA